MRMLRVGVGKTKVRRVSYVKCNISDNINDSYGFTLLDDAVYRLSEYFITSFYYI